MLGKTLIGRYKISGELGGGGFGVVYRAEDLVLGRQVAVKLLRPESADQDKIDGLAQEARMIARLDHPGITPLYDFNCCTEPPFLVMPILRGETLDVLLRNGPLDPRDTLEIALQISTALAYSHAHGVLHKDIQPGNVMVEWGSLGRPVVKLIDFGLAGESTADGQSKGLYGTPRFLSPEQLSSEPVDARSDIYSLGVTLYECITGRPAFSGDDLMELAWNILTRSPPSPATLGLVVDPALEELVMRCLKREPEERPGSADELVATLGKAARPKLPPLLPSSRLKASSTTQLSSGFLPSSRLKSGAAPLETLAMSEASGGRVAPMDLGATKTLAVPAPWNKSQSPDPDA